MTSEPRKQTIAIHILPDISGINRNQTMKFGHLIENNIRDIFLEKSYTKYGRETSPRSFYKKIKIERISGSTV